MHFKEDLLDWASHLRQSLVFDPVPTFLTLMIVSSHFYSCCLLPDEESNIEPSLLAALGWAARQGRTAMQIGSIRTPFFQPRIKESNEEPVPDRAGIRTPRIKERNEEPVPDRASIRTPRIKERNEEPDSMVPMTDPMTMMFDAWSYLTTDPPEVTTQCKVSILYEQTRVKLFDRF
jgi:hypothetical protein